MQPGQSSLHSDSVTKGRQGNRGSISGSNKTLFSEVLKPLHMC